MILAGDVGGTNCRLAWFHRERSRLKFVAAANYRSNEYSGLDEVVALFRDEHSITETIESAAFGVAGPVEDGQRVETTNLPWVVDRAHLCKKLKAENISLLNDLVANAYGTCWLTNDDYVELNAGVAHPGSNRALVSAGTGLGEAGLVHVDGQYAAVASEGGHCSFAPQQEIEFELHRFLQHKFGHVSWERVVSGTGLVNIFDFLCQTGSQTDSIATLSRLPELADLDPAAMISQAALFGLNATAEQALDIFIKLYGAEAGNVALKFLATGAIYLGGGIAPKILPRLLAGGFFEAFISKGRFSKLLEQISIYVILNDQTALLGAALMAARQAGYSFEKPPVNPISEFGNDLK